MHVCTIVARNYLAAARVLARSFAAHNPGGTCWTLVIDDADHEIDGADEPFEVVRPDDLAIAQWNQMVAGYSVLELSTAVKPWLLRHLLHDRGAPGITYLDPDIQVFGSLNEVSELLTGHAVVVNPHLNAAMPRDGHRPREPTSSSPAPSISASPRSPQERRSTSSWTGGPSAWPRTAWSLPSAATSSTSAGWTWRPA